MYGRDVKILRFFKRAKEPLTERETPFGIDELKQLEAGGFLSSRTKLIYGAPGETPLSATAFCITQRGQNAIWQATKNIIKMIFSGIGITASVIAAVISIITLVISA